MKLCCPNNTTGQLNARNSVSLPPASRSLAPAEARELADRPTFRERLDLGDQSEYLEEHFGGILPDQVTICA
jgi:hypothetical protein